jgi:hypothetical protein
MSVEDFGSSPGPKRARELSVKTLSGVVICVFVSAATLVAASSAVVRSSTGDTCAASGNGTAYTLNITLTSDAPPQGGFAFGAHGITVTNINIEGDTGNLSTHNLPANTTGKWLLANPPMPGGSVIAALTTSGPVTGSFTVVAATFPPSAFFEPFLCPLTPGTPAASNSFAADHHFTYAPATGTWSELVTVPGPGRVSFVQAVATAGAVTSKPLIQSGTLSVKNAGKIKLMLKPTAAGNAALKTAGSVKLKLTITFAPTNGRSASKVLGLTLLK